jgi:biotin operon repressor
VLARWLGVTGKTVYELTKAGIAVRAEHGDFYRLEESQTGFSC